VGGRFGRDYKNSGKLPDIFGQVSETEALPCQILLFVFPQSGAKIRVNWKFCPA